MNKYLLLIFPVFLFSCSPKIKSHFSIVKPALPYDSPVMILAESDSIPTGAEWIGLLKIGDSGFSTKCNYEIVIQEAKMEARRGGGNVIKIVEHRAPDFASTCHRIKAIIYKAEVTSELVEVEDGIFDPNAEYALIHVYRYGGAGALISYNLYLGDSLLCRVGNKYKETFKIRTKGKHNLIARTEATTEIPIEIEYGREYYLRCGVGMGVMVGRPRLELVEPETGSTEFKNIEFNRKRTE